MEESKYPNGGLGVHVDPKGLEAAVVFLVDAAHIAFNTIKMLGGGVAIGPILVGKALPAHVITESISVRGLVNMTALAVVDSQSRMRESLE